MRRPPLLKRSSTRWGIAIGLVVGAVIAAGFIRMRVTVIRDDSVRKPIVAVGLIQDYTTGGDGFARPPRFVPDDDLV